MPNKKERLLEIQTELIALEHLLVDISEAKRKRDKTFRQIIESLGKLVKKDLWKQYKSWCEEIFEERGLVEPEEAMEWLRTVFQQIINKLK